MFLQAGCPSCRPTNSVRALKEISHSKELLTPSSSGGLPSSNFVLDHERLLVNLGEGCHASHEPSDASTLDALSINIHHLTEHRLDFRGVFSVLQMDYFQVG